MVKKLQIWILLFVFFVCSAISPICSAKNNISADNNIKIEVTKEVDLPDEFNFIVNSKCSEHEVFQQATARKDGSFVIFHSGVFEAGVRSETDRKFIDIYDSDATFVEEISFETSSDVAIEFTQARLNIYLYSAVISYALNRNMFSIF